MEKAQEVFVNLRGWVWAVRRARTTTALSIARAWGAQRGKFDVVMAWAIDRIGRSLVDLLSTIEGLKACGVDLYLDQQAIDTTTPSGSSA
jgi:hypothetical protein